MFRSLLAMTAIAVGCAAAPLDQEAAPTSRVPRPTVVFRHGIITGPARARLVHDWLAQPIGDVMQKERAYCVTGWNRVVLPWTSGDIRGESIITAVVDLTPADSQTATPWSVRFRCSLDVTGLRSVPTVHTHPASYCRPAAGTCQPDSTQMTPGRCAASAIDTVALQTTRVQFAVVQCGPVIFSFYELTPAPSP